MKSSLLRCFFAAAVAVLSCSCGSRVIPKDKLAEIYADMFLADQWLEANPAARRTADTTCVYEAVFEKYGYDADDYRASLDHYMDDPERFSKILRKSASILEARLNELKAEKKDIQSKRPDIVVTFDFGQIMVEGGHGMLRMADRDSLEYYRDTAEVLVFDPFYVDVAEKARVKDSPFLDYR